MNPFEEYGDRCWYCRLPGQEPFGELDLELLQRCLEYARDTGQPLPDPLLRELIFEVSLLRGRRDSQLFKKPTKGTGHPRAEYIESGVVSYIRTCEELNRDPNLQDTFDPNPRQTIMRVYDITKSTIHRWMLKYEVKAVSNLNKAQLEFVISPGYVKWYRSFKPKQHKIK